MRIMLEFSRRRVFLNKKQEFTRKARDISTNINGGEKKTFKKKNIKGIENEEEKLQRKNLVKSIKVFLKEKKGKSKRQITSIKK